MVFEVYDDGVGMAPAQVAQLNAALDEAGADTETEQTMAPHFGLISVARRLNLFCGGRARIQIESELGAYTTVTLSFPAMEQGGTHAQGRPDRG